MQIIGGEHGFMTSEEHGSVVFPCRETHQESFEEQIAFWSPRDLSLLTPAGEQLLSNSAVGQVSVWVYHMRHGPTIQIGVSGPSRRQKRRVATKNARKLIENNAWKLCCHHHYDPPRRIKRTSLPASTGHTVPGGVSPIHTLSLYILRKFRAAPAAVLLGARPRASSYV